MIAHLVFGAIAMAAIVVLIALDAPSWLIILSTLLLTGLFIRVLGKSGRP